MSTLENRDWEQPARGKRVQWTDGRFNYKSIPTLLTRDCLSERDTWCEKPNSSLPKTKQVEASGERRQHREFATTWASLGFCGLPL